MWTVVRPLLLSSAALLICSHWAVSLDSEGDTSVRSDVARNDSNANPPRARHGGYFCKAQGGRCVDAERAGSCKTLPINKNCAEKNGIKRRCCAKEKKWDCPDCHNSPCTDIGGFCVKNKKACKLGHIVGGQCTCSGNKKGHCCVPGCINGWFMTENCTQHFCFMDDITRNWTDAKAVCEKQHMTLAEPRNPEAVRYYIAKKYDMPSWLDAHNETFAWLGASANGSTFTWQRDDSVLNNTSPFWFAGGDLLGERNTNDSCLLMLTTNYYKDQFPTTPYFSTNCSAQQWTLCELMPQAPTTPEAPTTNGSVTSLAQTTLAPTTLAPTP